MTSPAAGFGVATFVTGGVDLAPAQTYALIVADTTPSAAAPHVHVSTTASDYALGSSFSLNSAGTSFSDLYGATAYSGYRDIAFGATFSAPGLTAVPEPSTAVAGLGLAFVAGLVACRVIRRRRGIRALAIASPAASLLPEP